MKQKAQYKNIKKQNNFTYSNTNKYHQIIIRCHVLYGPSSDSTFWEIEETHWHEKQQNKMEDEEEEEKNMF